MKDGETGLRPENGRTTTAPDEAERGLDRLDRAYAAVALGFVAYVFLLWAWTVYVRWSPLPVMLALLVPAGLLGRWFTGDLAVERPVRLAPHVALWGGLLATVGFWVLPAVATPRFPVGQTFKDLHDGIAIHVAEQGRPPIAGYPPEGVDVEWIASDREGFFSAYSSAMHDLGALLIHLGFPELHALLGAMALACVVASLVAYLVLVELFGSREMAGLLGGFFTLTTFRVPLAFAVTAPQGFALTLALPAVWAVWLAERRPSWRRHVAAGLVLGLLGAAYQGPVLVLLAGLVGLAGLRLLLPGPRGWLGAWGRTGLAALLPLALAAGGQGPLYWLNLRGIYAFQEVSQLVLPFVRPVYALVLVPAVAIALAKGLFRRPLGLLVLGFALALALTLPWDLAIHAAHPMDTLEDRRALPPEGLLGGIRHQMLSRVSLMQPYFFGVLLGAWALVLRGRRARWIGGSALVGLLALVRIELPLYGMVSPIVPHAYRMAGANPLSPLSTASSFFNPPEHWDARFQEVVDWIDERLEGPGSVFYAPVRHWTPNRHAWLSIDLRRLVLTWPALGADPVAAAERRLAPPDLRLLERLGCRALFLERPTPEVLQLVRESPGWSEELDREPYHVFLPTGAAPTDPLAVRPLPPFDDPGWTFRPPRAWKAEGSTVRFEGGTVAVALAPSPAVARCSVSVRLRLGPEGNAGLLYHAVRADDLAGAELVRVSDGGERVIWGRFDDERRWLHGGRVELSPRLDLDAWHELRLEDLGGRTLVHLDGRYLATVRNGTAEGRVGLWARGSPAELTDLELRAPKP